MITYLDGFAPLQNKILLYCLGSNTAAIMQPIVAQMEQRRLTTQDINCETAWRCITQKPDKVGIALKKAKGYTFKTYLASLEMLLARLEMPGSDPTEKTVIENHVNMAKHRQITVINSRLTSPDIHCTPTGNLIRKYVSYLLMRGIHLKGNETLWARFSGEEVIFYSVCLEDKVNPRVLEDLNQALQKRKEEYDIRIESGNWEEDFF
jgi:hypothetical protein